MSVPEDSKGRRRWKPPADIPNNPGGGRSMQKKEKVKKKTLSKSSRDWVDRQLRDPYVRKAQEAGYRARAAYKLLEIDEKFHVLKRGARVVDLGSAPGGWLQVALEKGAVRLVGIIAEERLGDVDRRLKTERQRDGVGGARVDHDRRPALGEVQFSVEGAFVHAHDLHAAQQATEPVGDRGREVMRHGPLALDTVQVRGDRLGLGAPDPDRQRPLAALELFGRRRHPARGAHVPCERLGPAVCGLHDGRQVGLPRRGPGRRLVV